MRLPRNSSITHREDFLKIRKTGRSKAGRFLILSTLADPALDGPRVAFITTKRCGKAHDRVRLRRLFREFVRAEVPHFAVPARYLVTVALKDAKAADFAELQADWRRQARRLGLYAQPQP
jgi:ribonuclease P protein component